MDGPKRIEGDAWMKKKLVQKRKTGQVIVLMALTLALMLGFSALVLDYGQAAVAKAKAQKAADAAVLAAVI